MDNNYEELNDFNRYVPNPFSFRVPSGNSDSQEFTPVYNSSAAENFDD